MVFVFEIVLALVLLAKNETKKMKMKMTMKKKKKKLFQICWPHRLLLLLFGLVHCVLLKLSYSAIPYHHHEQP